MIERAHRENSAFSLIELIVALAVALIIVVVVGSIMVTSARTYSRANAESTVQAKAQLVMNQIEDLVIDTTGKADYGYKASKGGATEWGKLSDGELPAEPYSKTLRLCNDEKIYDLEWVSAVSGTEDAGELTYREYETADGENPTGSGKSERLSEGVESFSCDLSALSSNRIVGVNLILKRNERRYHAYKNISIRNPVFAAGATVSMANAVELVVTTPDITAEPNGKYALYGARVKVKSGNPSREVCYEVVRPSSGMLDATKVLGDGKTLQIASNERTRIINVKAYAVENPNVFEYISVYNRRVNSLGDITLASNTGTFSPGSVISLSCPIDYQSGADDSPEDHKKLTALYVHGWANHKEQVFSIPFTIPEDMVDGAFYELEVYSAHARKNGGIQDRDAYSYDRKVTESVRFYVESANLKVPVVSTREDAIYRGQESVTVSFNAFNNPMLELPSGYQMTTDHYFFYRPKEYRTVYKDSYEYLSSYTTALNKEKSAKFDWGNVGPEVFERLTADFGWREIPGHNDTSYKVPTEIFTASKLNEDTRYQLALVARIHNAGENKDLYALCARGEFFVPGYRVTIDDEAFDKQSYNVYQLNTRTTSQNKGLPEAVEDYIKTGQLERAFNRVVIDNGDNSVDQYDGRLALYATSSEDNTFGEAKELTKNKYNVITRDKGDNLYMEFRLENFKNQSFFKFPLSTNKPGNNTWMDLNTYRIHVVYSMGEVGDKYSFNQQLNESFDLHNQDKAYSLYPAYIELKLKRGNARVRYRRWNNPDNPAERIDDKNHWKEYDYQAAYIPPPGSEDDLINQYSLKQLTYKYRPAGKMQPVYINTLKEDWNTQQKEPYLIQMKEVDGVRWLRMWYAFPESVRELSNGSFQATKWFFCGEYKYNSDTEIWDLKSTTEPANW